MPRHIDPPTLTTTATTTYDFGRSIVLQDSILDLVYIWRSLIYNLLGGYYFAGLLLEDYKMKCKYCGKSFQCKRKDAKYCSGTCRSSSSKGYKSEKLSDAVVELNDAVMETNDAVKRINDAVPKLSDAVNTADKRRPLEISTDNYYLN